VRGLVLLLALVLPGCGLLLPPPLGNLRYEERPFGFVAGSVGLVGGAVVGAVVGGAVVASKDVLVSPLEVPGEGVVAGFAVGALAGAAAGSLLAVPLRFLEELLYEVFGWDEDGLRP